MRTMKRRRLLVGVAVVSNLLLFLINCREPTSILIEAQTNVVYRQGIVTSFTVGKPGTTENAEPTTESTDPWGASGVIGSLVVVPETSDDAVVSIKLVMGVGGHDPRQCTGTNPTGCIFARRRLRYTAHEQLRLPISLYARCEGVPCDALTTCNYLGACVISEIDPSTCATPSGCHPAEDPPRASTNADSGTDATLTTSDSSDDRSSPPIGDAATDRSDAKDGAPIVTPGTIDCRTVQCSLPQEQCCYNPLTQTGSCMTVTANCPAGNANVRCDGDEDCPSMGGAPPMACCAVNSSYVVCEPRSTCLGSGLILCHSTNICPLTDPPSACTGQAHNYYSSCVR
jgi:hypothetical protein